VSKGFFWSDPNDSLEILEPTAEAIQEYGTGAGADMIHLSAEHIQALLEGKMLAWSDSEYSTFVVLEPAATRRREKG